MDSERCLKSVRCQVPNLWEIVRARIIISGAKNSSTRSGGMNLARSFKAGKVKPGKVFRRVSDD
jgi:hypothetical protein